MDLLYSYGGFAFPIRNDDQCYTTLDEARTATLEALLQRWPKLFASSPASVHRELRFLREQVEAQLKQPSLF